MVRNITSDKQVMLFIDCINNEILAYLKKEKRSKLERMIC